MSTFAHTHTHTHTHTRLFAHTQGDMRSYSSDTDIYLASLHFSIMTLTTVGCKYSTSTSN